jgi:hypothetical protein
VRTRYLFGCFIVVCGAFACIAAVTTPAAFKFRDVSYWHRWSENHQHEFTPEHQEDLEKWTEMVTINIYPDVHDGDALAQMANAVLQNYKSHQAVVLRTNSVPSTADHPAEHFMAGVFVQPKFVEVAFARLKMTDNTGCSIVYSRRIYGEKIGDQMDAWLKSNGEQTEKALMEWSAMPATASLEDSKL